MENGNVETREPELPPGADKGKSAGHGHAHEVVVKVDSKPQHVAPGTYTVAAFKALVGIAADRELDELVNGTFEPLDDDDNDTISGHETFVSHVRTGGSA